MDATEILQLYKESMQEVKALIKDLKKDIADNYKEFGETKLQVNTLETKLRDYDEVKKSVRYNSRVTYAIGIIGGIALVAFQIWGGKI